MSQTTNPPEVRCPKCGSNQFVAGKKGFSGKKAVAGAVLTGGIGILAGTIGQNKIKLTCLNCANIFYPGDSQKAQEPDVSKKQPEEMTAGGWIVLIILIVIIIGIIASC